MKGRILTLTLVILVCHAVSAIADVVAKHKSSFEVAKIMSMEMTGIDYTKADRNYSEVTSKMTGGMMAMLGKGKPKETVSITRIDKALLWELDTEKKHYKEQTFAELKKDMEEMQGEADEAKDESDEDEYVWTVEVKNIDGRQNINGFDCKGVIGIATGVKKKDPSDSLIITLEQWMAQNVPGAAEMETYHKNYAQAIGVDEMWAKQGMGEMLKQYGSQFQELGMKLNEAGSYPIKTIMTAESPARPGGEEGDEESSGADNSMSGMMGKMSKMLGKQKEAEGEDAKAENGGRTKAFTMTNEVLSVELKSVPDSQFDIPTGYKKK